MSHTRIRQMCLLIMCVATCFISQNAIAEMFCYSQFNLRCSTKAIHLVNTQTMTDQILWTYQTRSDGQESIPGRCILSPDCKSLAFLEGYINRNQFVVYGLKVLPIGEQEPKTIAENVEGFCWSPDSARVVYSTAVKVRENITEDHRTWIYDVTTQQNNMLLSRGGNLYWAAFDGAVYLTEYTDDGYAPVLRVDPSTRKTDDSQYRGVAFCPGERYYWFLYEDTLVHVALRESNEDWFMDSACKVASWQWRFPVDRWLGPVTLGSFQCRWVGRYGVPEMCYLLNVETGDIRQSPYYLLGLIDNGTRVVEIIREGEFQIRKVSELEVFTEEEAKKMENATAEKPYVPPVK